MKKRHILRFIQSTIVDLPLLIVFLQAKALYFPVFWKGFPGFKHWKTLELNNGLTFIGRDFPLVVTFWAIMGIQWMLSFIGIRWFWTVAGIACLTAIVYIYNWIIAKHRIKKYLKTKNY